MLFNSDSDSDSWDMIISETLYIQNPTKNINLYLKTLRIVSIKIVN